MSVPTATYRVQLNASFTLDDARSIVPYLHALGISDLYVSPILAARPGSTHGYDVVDPTRIDPEIGGLRAFGRLTDELRARGMGLLLDIVPNHMAASAANPWWVDVLEHGRASRFASFFDIEWGAQDGKVLVPVLGRPYGKVLESGGFTLELGREGIGVRYEEHRFPLDPATYGAVVGRDLEHVEDVAARRALAAVLRAASALPLRSHTDAASIDRRARRSAALKRRLWRLHESEPAVRKHLAESLRAMNGRRGDPASFDAFDELLGDQAYRLSYWRLAGREVNYRRFFDITDLVALRMERDDVFAATHRLVLDLVERARVDALRVDHVDGLLDPREYLDRLRAAAGDVRIVVEKILASGEQLPSAWAADGTTGYEFAAEIGGLLTDARGERALVRAGDAHTGTSTTFGEVLYGAKLRVLRELFPGRLASLGAALYRLAHEDRHARDLTIDQVTNGLAAITAALPVYRTYTGDEGVREADRAVLEEAVRTARQRADREARPAVDFLGRVIALRAEPGTPRHTQWRTFTMRWQQFTAPVTAKGLEDTALYAYVRLASSNDVGQHPVNAARTPDQVHDFLAGRAVRSPRSLNASSTHDTKRSEDVRARIAVLAQIPQEWSRRFERWHTLVPPGEAHGLPAPDANEEILFHQTVVGVYPPARRHDRSLLRRLQDFMVKAARETKRNTSWIDPDREYETAVRRYVARALDHELYVADIRSLVDVIAPHGALASLSTLLLKATAPGIPDVYQGTETWNDSLVDPDNRRPVDHGALARMLAECDVERRARAQGAAALMASWPDGRIKLFLTRAVLHARRCTPDLFDRGAYLPLRTSLVRVFAFARHLDDAWALTIVPRLTAAMGWPIPQRTWDGAAIVLPEGAPQAWTNALTDEPVATQRRTVLVRDAFASIPLALLLSA